MVVPRYLEWYFHQQNEEFGHLGLESSRILLVEPGSFFSGTLLSSVHSSEDHSAFSSALGKVEVVEKKVVVVERNVQNPLQDSG